MIDPPRPEAIAAVKACQDAGIQVKMITGDHALTAAAIAGQLGLQVNGQTETSQIEVITGSQLAAMSDQQVIEAAGHTAVLPASRRSRNCAWWKACRPATTSWQ